MVDEADFEVFQLLNTPLDDTLERYERPTCIFA